MTPLKENETKEVLRVRHLVLRSIREFFYGHGYLEVETPYLMKSAPPDPYIEPLRAFSGKAGPLYLHTSPEIGMKKILAAGIDRIFQVCKVFRVEEFEERHSTEFTMLEWYRPGTYLEAMEETEELIRFVDRGLNGPGIGHTGGPWKTYRLAELFLDITGIDPLPLSREDLKTQMNSHGFKGLGEDEPWEDLFFKLLVQEVEPCLEKRERAPYFIKDWPASLTAMAKRLDPWAVERFELYMSGLEIANGYSELLNPEEQKGRLIRDNEERLRLGKESFPLDEAFLDAISSIPGPVAGVSIGVDRLLMALLGKESIAEVLPDRLTVCP